MDAVSDGGGDLLDRFPHGSLKLGEFGYNGLAVKGLTLSEAYGKGRLDICFVLDCGLMARCSPLLARPEPYVDAAGSVEVEPAPASVGIQAGDFSHLIARYDRAAAGGDNELMLVLDVQHMQPPEQFIPTLVRFESVNRSDDICSGEVYLSVLNGVTQAFRVSREGKLDLLRPLCLLSDQRENQQVQGCPQIVDGVSDYQGEIIWDGLIGFDVDAALTGLCILRDHHVERFLTKKLGNLPVKVIDVVLGPLNL